MRADHDGGAADPALDPDAAAHLAAEPLLTPRAALPPLATPPPKVTGLFAMATAAMRTPDLISVPVPIGFHEPLSELQQRAEDYEYVELLNQAAEKAAGSLARHLLVAAFALSAYAGVHRVGRPFSSLLGETYELVRPDLGFRFLAEKVAHAPRAVNRATAEAAAGWRLDTEDELAAAMSGTTIVLAPAFLARLRFADGDAYTWGKAATCVHGALLGPRHMWVQHKGTVAVASTVTDAVVTLEIGRGWGRRNRDVSGRARTAGGADAGLALRGAWDARLEAVDDDTGEVALLWACASGDGKGCRHTMTRWTASLNAPPRSRPAVPPPPASDARHRSDMRALEGGRWGDAAAAREAGLERQAGAACAHAPTWFQPVAPLGTPAGRAAFVYEYRGGYWAARAARATERAAGGGGGDGGAAGAQPHPPCF